MFDTKQSFFDTPPSKQSRLLTFRCPNRQENDPDNSHLITIAWKGQNASNEDVTILVENANYRGKPLILLPSAIKNHTGECFPAGTLYTACSCMAKKGAKIRYRVYDIIDLDAAPPPSTEDAISKVTKKISKDLVATTQMLVQLNDDLEGFIQEEKQAKQEFAENIIKQLQESQEKNFRMILEDVFKRYERRIIELLKISRTSSIEIPEIDAKRQSSEDEKKYSPTELNQEITTDTQETKKIESTSSESAVKSKETSQRLSVPSVKIHRVHPIKIDDDEEELGLPDTQKTIPKSLSISEAFAKNNEEEEDDRSAQKYNPGLGVTRVIEAAMYKKAFQAVASQELTSLDDIEKGEKSSIAQELLNNIDTKTNNDSKEKRTAEEKQTTEESQTTEEKQTTEESQTTEEKQTTEEGQTTEPDQKDTKDDFSKNQDEK